MKQRIYTVFINRTDDKGGLLTYCATFSTEEKQLQQIEAIEQALAKEGYENLTKRDKTTGGKWRLGNDTFYLAATESDLDDTFVMFGDNKD